MQTEITFRFAGKNFPLLLVPTFVNDRGPFEFILDTGASHCILSTELAHKLQITGGEARIARDAGGTIQMFENRVTRIAVGATAREHVAVGIADWQALSQTLGTSIAGNLGYNYFTGLRITIDYQKETLRLVESKQGPAHVSAGESAPIPFKVTPLLLIPVMVNGQGPFEFVLDTGASGTLLSPELAQGLGLTPTETLSVTGASSIAMGSKCMLESLALGATVQRHLSVIIADIFGPLPGTEGRN